ncbi:hypothetical protein CMQ_5132 [Grosmannia clavigera kw1407]|uniref:Uncharacterized protein n=1 Tax=Grosmannia clavigera (strain kw1407 / UAMH 11150) TaxID=655863 RepID=F0XBM3_GROCL|nr:uncharacterized protein CMQ_5132 [Grosmannia clavigera kw1407]EFX04870.1 hypothetical protein CMQ_5132 [Grosmannia clavigera kw1407]
MVMVLAPSPVSPQPGHASLGSTSSVSSHDGSDASGGDNTDGNPVPAENRTVVTLFAPDLEYILRAHNSLRGLCKNPGRLEPNFAKRPLPNPRPIWLAELSDVPLTARLLILPPLSNYTEGYSLRTLLCDLGKRRLGILDAPSADLACKLYQPDRLSFTEEALENVVLTPDMVGLAARFTENDANNSLINNMHVAGGDDTGDGNDDENQAVPTNNSSLQSFWEYPPNGDRTAGFQRVISNGVISYGIGGLQGIALGHMLGPSVRLCLDGMPLEGMARRLSQLVSGGVDADRELRVALGGLTSIRLTVGGPGNEVVTAADMDALKRLLLLASPNLETLIVRATVEAEHDGYAGADRGDRRETGEAEQGRFYLPAFSFLPGERLPPLRYLHLWRYDWRRHSSADVAAHWDFSQLRTLLYDGAPLRWFLGTLSFACLAGLQTLRLDDAEWALQPGQGRQAALLVGYLLQHHIKELRQLELVRCYTDNLPMAALRRHVGTLEALVLRHPYGVGGGSTGDAAGAELSDAAAANITPLSLHALFEEGSNEEVGSDGMYVEMTVETRRALLLKRRGNPVFSRLKRLEIDMDDRHVAAGTTGQGTGNAGGPPEGIEAETLSRLARLPRLESLTLAMPSALRGLHCVPRYDVDLHQTLQRLVYLLGQREELKRRHNVEAEWLQDYEKRCHDGRQQQQQQQLPEMASLNRIAVHIGGWMPPRGTGIDETGMTVTHWFPPTAARPVEPTMLTAANGAGAWAAPTFLAPSRDVDVSPGVGAALALRAIGLRSQRCLVAERSLDEDCEDCEDEKGDQGEKREKGKGKEKARDGRSNADEGGSGSGSGTANTKIGSPAHYTISEEYSDLVEYVEDRPKELSWVPGQARHVRVRQPYEIRFARPRHLAEGPLWDVNGLAMWP